MSDRGRPAQSLEPTDGVAPIRLPYTANTGLGETPVRARLTLAGLVATAWRCRVAFTIGVLSTFGIAATIIFSLRCRYELEALLMVDPRKTNITDVQSIQGGEATLSDLSFVRGQMQILTSDENARHQEARRLQASAASDLAIAQSNTRELEVTLNEINRRLSSTSQDKLTAFQLNRGIEADRRLYDDLLLRFNQVSIQNELREPDTRIVSGPALPLEPAFPHRGLLLAVAAMAAVAVGELVAFLIDMLSGGKAISLRDVEASCGIAGLVVIPRLGTSKSRLAALSNAGTYMAASLQILKNSITFRINNKLNMTVFVSALSRQGKTLLATLNARSVAAEGRRVLLVDADLCRFGSSYTPIVIDTPPVAVVDGALHLAVQADASVPVARWNHTSLTAIYKALGRLSLAGGRLVGVAITATEMRKYRSGADNAKNFVKYSSYYIMGT